MLDAAKQLELEEELALMEREKGIVSEVDLLAFIKKGWRYVYSELFGQQFVSSFAPHHIEAIEWHWESRLAFLENRRPDYLAYFPIWSRGHMKSTVAEHMVVVDAVLSVAFKQPGFCLYVSRNKPKVQEHIGNIETLLSSEGVRKYCPDLSTVKRNEETNQQRRWTASFLQTQTDYSIKGGSLDSGMAGSRVEQTRPTFIVPDDIDGREESEVIAEDRFNKLTTEVLPMRQGNTLVFFAQNLINKYSVMYRIQKGHKKVLTNRKPTKPVPAVLNLETESRVVDGGPKDIYISGTSTWHVWDAHRIQDEIDTEGLPAFERECQHDVENTREGRFHKNYIDDIHAISISQFESVYGREAWKAWYKAPFSDWSRTKTKFHANVAGYLAVSSGNTKYPGFTFCIPFSFPEETQPEDVAERMLSELTPYAYGTEGNQVTWKQLINDAWKRLNADNYYSSVSDKLAYRTTYYKGLIPQYAQKVLKAYKVGTGANSHSEDKVRGMLNNGFGFGFQASNPGKTDALEDIDAAMKFDIKEPHIFDRSKMGYTRWYVLCKNDYSVEPEIINNISVYPPVAYPDVIDPKDLHDDDLFRYQMVERRFRPPKLTESGEMTDEPEKLNDDFGQALQMVYFKNLLQNIKLTKTEEFEEQMAQKGLTRTAIEQIDDEKERLAQLQIRVIEERAFASKEKGGMFKRVGVPTMRRR
jgi:hypothetical protein